MYMGAWKNNIKREYLRIFVQNCSKNDFHEQASILKLKISNDRSWKFLWAGCQMQVIHKFVSNIQVEYKDPVLVFRLLFYFSEESFRILVSCLLHQVAATAVFPHKLSQSDNPNLYKILNTSIEFDSVLWESLLLCILCLLVWIVFYLVDVNVIFYLLRILDCCILCRFLLICILCLLV